MIIKITFSDHSLKRMKKRRITKEEVRLTLLQPDHSNVAKYGLYESFKRIGPKNIKVIYEMRDTDHAHVVTVKKMEG